MTRWILSQAAAPSGSKRKAAKQVASIVRSRLRAGRRLFLSAFLASAFLASTAAAQAPVPVDVELVLAVDVSGSMTAEELETQRRGYAAALVDDVVLWTIRRGHYGQVAVAYLEWAGAEQQRVAVDWTLIRDRDDGAAFAAKLTASRQSTLRLTAISSAIDYAVDMFDGNGFASTRRVIDISGDAPGNDGRLVTLARDEAVARGVVINGLPLMTTEPEVGRLHLKELDVYYRDCVIGGDSAFMIPVKRWSDFADAVRKKMLLEFAGLTPEPPPRLWLAHVGEFGDFCAPDERRWRPSWWIPAKPRPRP